MNDYSIKNISPTLMSEIEKLLKSVDGYGSLEIYINGGIVTQMTVRNIKKTLENQSTHQKTV